VLSARNVDSDRWRAEVERQAPKLRIVTDARDWRSHLDGATGHTKEVGAVMPDAKGMLDRMHGKLAEELDRLGTRERMLNDQFESLRLQYKEARQGLDGMRERYNQTADEVSRRTNELQRCVAELEDIKSQLDERGAGNSNSSPLIRTREAMRNLEKEIRELNVTIGVVEHACLQRARR